jgi:tryptophanyl-tRNA synthetase
LQDEAQCYYFVADWHALTTHYETPEVLAASVWDMLIDWFAAGLDPVKSTVFIQSRVPEHAELFLLLSMATPLGWLERVPTYKDQIEKLKDKDLSTYGFLGYPLMQAADILIYRASQVPVGEDQVPHIEMTRETARRFNHLFGREPGFEQKVEAALKKLGGKAAKTVTEARQKWTQDGDAAAKDAARAAIAAASIPQDDRERLLGWIDGTRRTILVEPAARLTETPKLPGLDGAKMSKSYGNAVLMREDPKQLTDKLRKMPTDPARVRRTDPGEPERCPVWQLHKVYSNESTQAWAAQGCRSAGIGCLECKQPVIDAMLAEQQPWRERAQPFLDRPQLLREIVDDGCARARATAQETMRDVREAMGLTYR